MANPNGSADETSGRGSESSHRFGPLGYSVIGIRPPQPNQEPNQEDADPSGADASPTIVAGPARAIPGEFAVADRSPAEPRTAGPATRSRTGHRSGPDGHRIGQTSRPVSSAG